MATSCVSLSSALAVLVFARDASALNGLLPYIGTVINSTHVSNDTITTVATLNTTTSSNFTESTNSTSNSTTTTPSTFIDNLDGFSKPNNLVNFYFIFLVLIFVIAYIGYRYIRKRRRVRRAQRLGQLRSIALQQDVEAAGGSRPNTSSRYYHDFNDTPPRPRMSEVSASPFHSRWRRSSPPPPPPYRPEAPVRPLENAYLGGGQLPGYEDVIYETDENDIFGERTTESQAPSHSSASLAVSRAARASDAERRRSYTDNDYTSSIADSGEYDSDDSSSEQLRGRSNR
ncbi:uncharacterized protein V1518DRAFT_411348 [Limtongia smithiae]|uniref:uncharacterized protein n=1 Tax=Limtongia smithiae TaxID=1125753 RepID=UPI0034CE694B